MQVNLAEKLQMKMNSSNKQKHGYLIHTWSDKALKGTDDRTLSSRITWN